MIRVLNMSAGASGKSDSVVWTGKPWILSGVVTRSISIVVIAVVISWLELFFNVANKNLLNIGLILWTGLAFFIIWVLSLAHLLLLRVSTTYILRNDSLEIRTGILTQKSFVVAASGFADMEVRRTLSARMMNLGDIIIRTQDESGADRKIERIKNPLHVADQIREVMAKPIVRIEGQKPSEEKK
jgi:membrane protein YdbS with pleckstrin-like domain